MEPISSDSSLDEEMQEDTPQPNRDLQVQRIKFLRGELQQNPVDYKISIELIKLLEDAAELDEVRVLRENLATTYPLPEHWVTAEQRLASSDSERAHISELYKRACVDYLSVELWCKRLLWEYELFLDTEDITKAQIDQLRDLLESAIVHCGLHVPQGHRVWGIFIQVEKDLLSEYPEHGSQERIRNLYKRQFSVPLKEMKQQFIDYTTWEAEVGGKDCPFKTQYEANLQTLEALLPFEERISDTITREGASDFEQLGAWKEYIAFQLKGKIDINRTKCLFERALKNYFLVFDIWNDYLTFVQTNIRVATAPLPILERAVRNSPCFIFWDMYLSCLEQAQTPIPKITTTFKTSLTSALNSEYEYKALFNRYFDIRVRHSRAGQSTEDLTDLKQELKWAAEYVQQYFPTLVSDMLLQWARIEAHLALDLPQAIAILETIVGKHDPTNWKIWEELINMNIQTGQTQKCTNLFQKALTQVHDFEGLAEKWGYFERFHGTLQSAENANKAIQKKRIQYQQAYTGADTVMAEDGAQGIHQEGMRKNASEGDQPRKKLRAEKKPEKQDSYFTQMAKKERAQHREDPTASLGPLQQNKYDTKVLHVAGLPPTTSDGGLTQLFEQFGTVVEVRLSYTNSGKFKQFAFVEFADEEAPKKAIEAKDLKYDETDITVDYARQLRGGVQPVKTEVETRELTPEMEGRTLFIVNIPFRLQEPELKQFFSSKGEECLCLDFRLSKNEKGTSRGFGYADYKDKETAEKAAGLYNGAVLEQLRLKASISRPPPGGVPRKETIVKKTGGPGEARGRGRGAAAPRGRGGPPPGGCRICGEEGHWARECPTADVGRGGKTGRGGLGYNPKVENTPTEGQQTNTGEVQPATQPVAGEAQGAAPPKPKMFTPRAARITPAATKTEPN